MAAKKGGYAVQEQYRLEGRDPTAKASYVDILPFTRAVFARASTTAMTSLNKVYARALRPEQSKLRVDLLEAMGFFD